MLHLLTCMLVLQVLHALASLCSSPGGAAVAMASAIPFSYLELPAVLGLMLQHMPGAVASCMDIFLRVVAASPEASSIALLPVVCQPAVLEVLLATMCSGLGDQAEKAAGLIMLVAQQVDFVCLSDLPAVRCTRLPMYAHHASHGLYLHCTPTACISTLAGSEHQP
jgi:hypothetical protein